MMKPEPEALKRGRPYIRRDMDEYESLLAHCHGAFRCAGGGDGGAHLHLVRPGRLGALAAAAASAPVIVQIVVFLGVSFLTLLLVRPLAQRFVNDRKVATNADRVIGREAVVTEDIDNIQGKGRVSISGADWTARTEDDRPIPAGSKVQVLRIEGVKVIVAPAGAAGDPQQAQP